MLRNEKSTTVLVYLLLLGLAFCLLFPSIPEVQKYLGLIGVAASLLSGGLSLVVGHRFILPLVLSRVTEKQSLWLGGFTLAGLAVAFAVVYPIANSGVVGGGSDRDEALNIAAAELLHGRFPYYLKTYLNAPISPLPGSVVLAIPFVLLGNSAYQNLFWLPAFFLALRLYLGDGRRALLLIWLLALSPLFLQQLVTGSDRLANPLFVMLFILLLTKTIPRDDLGPWSKIAPAVLFGIGLASRANFILLVPLVFSALVQSSGWRPALVYVGLGCITLGAFTVPFYLWDPENFSPLHTASLFSP